MTGNSRFAVSVHTLAYLTYKAGQAVPSAEIAESVHTNPVVIRRVLSELVKAKIVTATKGAAGGFTLAQPAEDVTLLDIYHAVEPKPNHGLNRFAPNHACPVGGKIENILQGVFAQAQAGMEAELKRVTLAEVFEQLHTVCTGAAATAGAGAKR